MVVTNYNYGFFLDRCLRSLIDQDDNNYEILVVDDNSSDYSHEILDHWECEGKLRVVRNKRNVGLGAACNVAIESCRSRYVVRVDADDYVCKDFVHMLSRFLDHGPIYDAVACDYYIVSKDQKLDTVSAEKEPIACGIMFRKEVLWDIGMYNPDRTVREDTDLRLRFEIGGFKMGYLTVPLYRYHKHDDSLSEKFEGDKKDG